MASLSKRFASTVSLIASLAYFLIIICQLPLFRVPCETGMCRSPVEVICSQLYASKYFPDFGVKFLLYPGAIAKAWFKSKHVPSYNDMLKFFNLRKTATTANFQNLEIVVGSYLAVAGAPLCLLGKGRLSLFGALLILWAYVREATPTEHGYPKHAKVDIYLGKVFIAALCAFLSIRKDVRKLIHSFRPRKVAKSLESKAKYL